ncbi:MAG: hypothetical protein ACOH13_12295 [Flavobacteriales bacterium]
MAITEYLRWAPLLFLPSLVSAQVFDSTAVRHRLSFQGTANYDSDAIHNDVLSPLVFGGMITREARQCTLDAIGDHGRAGAELGACVSATWANGIFGHDGWQMRTSLAWQYAVGLRFSPDAFAVGFFGNAAFEGQTAKLAPLRFEQWHYQRFGIGIEDARSGSFLELAVVNGTNFNRADVHRADLFTATDGRYLDMDLSGSYQRSDTAANAGSSTGIGAALNAKWATAINAFGGPSRFSLELSDGGFMKWNAGSLSASLDSVIHFEGVAVNDILDLNGPVIDRTTLQDSLGLGYTTGSVLRPLPARIEGIFQFGKLKKPGHSIERSAYEVAVEQRWLPGYIPKVRVLRRFGIGRSFIADAGVAYGGFGGLRAMARIGYCAKAGLAFELETPNAIGLVSDQAAGKAVGLRMQLLW